MRQPHQAKPPRILICAPSNNAVDVIGARLNQNGIPFVRIGREEVINPDLRHHSLQAKANELARERAGLISSRGGRSSYTPIPGRVDSWDTRLQQATRDMENDISPLIRECTATIMEKFSVVLSTLSSSATWPVLESGKFDTIIVDEAAQATAPETIIPFQTLKFKGRFILVGGKCNPQDTPF